MTFEGSLERLESIVEELEGAEVPLERALALFEEGIGHLRVANDALREVDARVRQLSETADGTFSVEEIDL